MALLQKRESGPDCSGLIQLLLYRLRLGIAPLNHQSLKVRSIGPSSSVLGARAQSPPPVKPQERCHPSSRVPFQPTAYQVSNGAQRSWSPATNIRVLTLRMSIIPPVAMPGTLQQVRASTLSAVHQGHHLSRQESPHPLFFKMDCLQHRSRPSAPMPISLLQCPILSSHRLLPLTCARRQNHRAVASLMPAPFCPLLQLHQMVLGRTAGHLQ